MNLFICLFWGRWLGTRIVLDRRCPGERAEREPCRFGVDTTLEGSSRGCHECVGSEVCVALALEGPPICRPASDPQDPTGCAGHCRHGSEICQRLDHNAFRWAFQPLGHLPSTIYHLSICTCNPGMMSSAEGEEQSNTLENNELVGVWKWR